MKKSSYNVIVNTKHGFVAEKAEGYVVDAPVPAIGDVVTVGLRNTKGGWTVDELNTGSNANPGHKFNTRKEAYDYVMGCRDLQTGKTFAELMGNMLENHAERYAEHKAAFTEIVAENKVMPIDELTDRLRKANKRDKEKTPVETKATTAEQNSKPEPPKSKPKPPKQKKKETAPVETATKVCVETMRKWIKGKEGLRVERAGKSDENPIWICGPSKPYREELMAMGFRWGTSRKFGKGWHYDPIRAAKVG